MMHSLSNYYLTVTIANKGAELQSVYHHHNKVEYMWKAGPEWPKKSPVLFPIVGGLKNGRYVFNGKEYQLPRHGFARDMDFDLLYNDNDTLRFGIRDNDTTLAVYPFHFNFIIEYKLVHNTLSVSYLVENTGAETMYFSVGAHPAFAVPLANNTGYDDYYLEFEQTETTDRWPLTPEGLIDNNPTPFLNYTMHLPLVKDLFIKDAIVFKNLASTKITLQSEKTPLGLSVEFKGFPYLGLWAANNANFVCIEPWYGIADGVDASGELTEKEGINHLTTGSSFDRSYAISFF